MKFVAPLLLCFSIEAATYYVDPVAGDNSNNGTSTATAWAQLPDTVGASGSGWVSIVNGDTVLVKGGSVNNVRVNFSSAYWNGALAFDSIILRSGDLHSTPWGTGRAIIDGENTRTGGFAMGDSGTIRGLTIDGFEIRNIAAGAAGVPWDGTTGSSCILPGANDKVYFLTIKRCYLHDATRTVDNTGHGIEFASGCTNFIITQNIIGPNIGTKGCETFKSNFGVISNNYFCGSGDHEIALSGSTNVDCCNNLIFYQTNQVHEPAYGIQVAECSKCDVWNNVIYRPSPFPLAAGESWSMGIGCYSGGLSNRIIFNTVALFGDYLNSAGSTAIRLLDTTGSDTGLVFQNNLVYGCWNAEGAAYYVRTNYAIYENVQYNCFYNSSNVTQMCFDGISGGTSYPKTVANFEAMAWPWATYANNQQADPGLTGGTLPTGLDANWRPNSNGFSLSTNSPSGIRSTGNSINGDSMRGWNHSASKFQLDIAGVTRTSWSIGAYEYAGPIYSIRVSSPIRINAPFSFK